MNYPLYLARRLSLKGEGRRGTPAIGVAIAAVALSIAVMLASVAIVTGFKHEITERVRGFNSDMTLSVVPLDDDAGNDNILTLTPTLKSVLDSTSFVKGYSLQASLPAILKTQTDFKGVYMRGLGPRSLRSLIGESLEEGHLPAEGESGETQIVVSRGAANQLRLKTGDRIDTYFISDDVRVRRLEISGIYNSHFDNYDNLFIFGQMPLIRKLGGIKENQGISLTIDTDDFEHIEDNSADLQRTLLKGVEDGTLYRYYQVDNAIRQGAGFFNWLSLLDTNVAVVLVLMTFVACVTLVSGMLILILDKKALIGTLKALGAPNSKIRRIFVYLSVRVALRGMAIGNSVMLLLLLAQERWHFIPLDPDSYYMDFVPVKISWSAILLLNVGVALVIWLSLILPSGFVSRISPAELLRSSGE